MANYLVILYILLCAFSLGSLVLLQFLTFPVRLRLNLIFASISLGIGVSGWIALVLAEAGLFSLRNLFLCWGVVFLVLLILFWWRKLRGGENKPGILLDIDLPPAGRNWRRWIEGIILVTWIAAAGWLFFRPHEYIMGGADAGVYISLGAEIAQNGGFKITDDHLATLDPVFSSAVLRPLLENPVASSYLVPGFYVSDAGEGAITPQFYPLHPTWLAIAFSLAGDIVAGVRTELLLTGLWMLLSTLSLYLIVRQLSGKYAAVLLLIAFSLTALQVWFARYPATEALAQFLLWTGLWALMTWLDQREPRSMWALLAGLMLGSVFLVRIDILIMLPIFVLFIVALWGRGWQKSNWWFLLPFTFLIIHSLSHGIVLSAPYFYEHIGFGLRILSRSWLVPVLAVLIGTIFLVLVYYFKGRFSGLERFQRSLQMTLIALILLGALYGWFIRPLGGQSLLVMDAFSQSTILLANHENFLRLGWYLFPTGVWFGIIGCCLLIWHAQWKTAVLLAVGLLFSALYLWDVRANPHHVYVMRRYVPVAFPFFILCGAYLLGWLVKWPRDWQSLPPLRFFLGMILAVIWLFGLGWSARGFISQVDHFGVYDQLVALEEAFDPNSILVFNDQSPVGLGDFWGTPLKFIFGHDVYSLRDPEILHSPQLVEMIEIWQNNGRSVVWIGESTWLENHGFPYQQEIVEIHSQRLESSYEHKPQAIVPVRWILPISHIEQR